MIYNKINCFACCILPNISFLPTCRRSKGKGNKRLNKLVLAGLCMSIHGWPEFHNDSRWILFHDLSGASVT